jgi:hypothetical protein
MALDADVDLVARVLSSCAEVLGPGEPDWQASFFELGGNSLLAMQLLARVRNVLGQEPSLVTLYQAASLAEFAGLAVAERMANGATPPAVATSIGTPRASVTQELWHRPATDMHETPWRLMSAAFRVDGGLDIERLSHAMNLVAAAHESLRTAFRMEGGLLVRDVADAAGVPVEVHPADDRDDVAWIQEQLKPFDVSRAPLVRVVIRRYRDARCLVLFVVDHIVMDGWSMRVMLDEIGEAYAHRDESAFRISPEPVPFGDWADRQRAELGGDVHRALVERWRSILGDDAGILGTPLPGYRMSAAVTGVGRIDFGFDTDTTARLKRFCGRLGVSAYAGVLAAYARAVCAETGRTRVLFTGSTANRRTTDEQRTIGPLFEQLHLLLDLGSADTVESAAVHVHRVVAEAIDLSRIPHRLLRNELWPEAEPHFDTRTNPIMYVSLNPRFSQDLTLGSLAVESVDFDWLTAPTGTEMLFVEERQGLVGTLRWEAGRLPTDVCERLVSRLQTELRSV